MKTEDILNKALFVVIASSLVIEIVVSVLTENVPALVGFFLALIWYVAFTLAVKRADVFEKIIRDDIKIFEKLDEEMSKALAKKKRGSKK